MRLALVSGYDWSVPGGVQGQVRALAGALAEKGVAVTIFSPGPGSTDSLPAGVALEAIGRSRSVAVNGSRAPIAPGPGAFWATWRGLSSLSPDLVHVHEPFLPGAPLAALYSKKAPVVATFHRAGTDALYRLEGRLLGASLSARLAAATGVSVAAIETARTVLGKASPLIEEIGNGADIGRFKAVRQQPSGRFKSQSGPVVVFLGRLEPRKGVAVLIEAARYFGAEVRVVIAGEGPDRHSLAELARERPQVSFTGLLDDEAAARLIGGADVFVAPALGGESFGVVLLEAMAAGTAVVASDITGYRLAAGGAARLFRPGDGAGLAAVVGEVLGDDEARRHLVERGLERAEACSMEQVAEAYLELYRRVLSARAH